jgi:predicted N-acetyltransferase YhbS
MNRAPFSIRRAVPSEAEAILAVHRASVETLCVPAYSPEHIASWFEGRTSDIYAPALAAGQLWVADVQGRIAGFVGAEPGEVTLLFVLPEFAGQGVGRALFEFGLSMAESTPGQAVIVVATRNSESFYARYGFNPLESQFLVRGNRNLRYPVIRMLRPASIRRPPTAADSKQHPEAGTA